MKCKLTVLLSLFLYINALAQFNEEIPDEWSGIANETEHIPRHENSFTKVGDKFYLLGGRESDIVEIYDPTTKTWTQGAQAPIELNHFQATEYQGLLWAIGAFKDNNFPTEQPAEHIYVYDPVADTWIQGPEVPAARRRGSSGLVVYNDKFYLVSGVQNGHSSGWVPWLDEYDPATNTWVQLPDAPQARDHFHAVLVGDKIYLAGGRRSGQQNTFAPLVPEVDVYDLSSGQWQTGAALPDDLPTPRAGTAAVNFQGEVIVIGGEGTQSGPAFAHTEALNVASGQWRRLADMVNPRHGTQAAVSGRGIYITSGSPTRGGGRMNNMEIYGLEEPEGDPVVASNLSGPEGVAFENTDEISISISNQGGNQALYISGIALEGEDAGAFELTGSGNLATGMFIAPGTSRNVSIKLQDMPDVPKTASLVIQYGAGEEVAIPLSAEQEEEEIDPLGEPQNISASDGEFEDKIVVTWDGVAGATHYQVYRAGENDPGTATPISDWQTATSFEDTEAETGTTYFYFVKAASSSEGENASGFSAGVSGFLEVPEVIEENPAIDLSGDMGFGNVTVGETAERTLTIGNPGDADLEVSSIEYPEGFSGDWEGGTVSAGGSVEVSVVFAPTAAQNYSGDITVNSNAETGAGTIAVSGTGQAEGPQGPSFTLRLNTGRLTGDPYTDSEGISWSNDDFYTEGKAYPPVPSGPYNQLQNIEFENTDRHTLYRSERIGVDGWEYGIPVENGEYIVRLHFAEIYWNVVTTDGGPGSRIFEVYLEEGKVLEDYDMLAKAGPATAIEELFKVKVEDGTLNIKGVPIVDQAKISAIEVFGNDGGIHVKKLLAQSNFEGDNVEVQLVAFGGEGVLSYSAEGLPPGLEVNPATGLVTGEIETGASAANEGRYEVTVTVSDGIKDESASFTWRVFGEIPDLWTNIANDPEHTGRHDNALVQVGDKFYLLGGRESDLVEIYDPATTAWSQGAAAPLEFNNFQAVAHQGLIWVMGAFEDDNFPTEQPASHIYIYDPMGDEWVEGPEIPEGRRRGSAGLVAHNGKLYLVAGIQNGHTDGWVPWLDEYDPATNTWTELPDAPRARDQFQAVVTGNKLYAIGGRRSGEQSVYAPLVPEVDVYDFSEGRWLGDGETPGNIPTSRAGAATVNFRGKILLIGGEGTQAGPAFRLTEALDVNTGTWTTLANLNVGRHGTQAIVSGPGIFISSGSPQRGGGNITNMEVYGFNEPEGSPLTTSELTAPQSVGFANSTDVKYIAISNTGGNQALYIKDIALGGDGASAFEILEEGSLKPGIFIAPGTSKQIAIKLTEVPQNPVTASLVINYGTGKEIEVELDSDAEELSLEVDAGEDRTILLPTNSVELEAQVSGAGETLVFEWAQESGPALADLEGETTSVLMASNLVAGEYIFRVTVNSNGSTAYDEVKVTVKAIELNTPQNVSASEGVFEDKVVVVWDEVSGATHYQVYRAEENDPASATAISSWITATNYEDEGAEDGKVYYYFVKAASNAIGANESGFSTGASGFVKVSDGPAVSLSGNLGFGNVAIGEDSVKVLTITNSGGGDLEVSSIDYPEGFSGDWESGTIGPGQSVEVAVTFSPLEEKNYSGPVVINSNAETGPASIEATGQGGEGAPTGIGKHDISNTVMVYPNPVKEEFNVRLENDLRGIVQVRVLNTIGQQISSYELEKQAYTVEHKIGSSQLPQGLYLIEVTIGRYKAVKRVNK